MTVTTEEYWEVDGVTLNTLAYNIETLSGRVNVPPLRGTDLTVAYRSGNLWRQKTPGARTLTLGMWVRDSDVDGVAATTDQARRAAYNDNLRTLQRLFFKRTELVITKRIRTESGLLTVSGLGQLSGQMELSPEGYNLGRLVIDFMMADPFFYGSLITSSNIVTGASATVVNNIGDDYADRKILVEFHGGAGGLVNPQLVNNTTGATISLSAASVIIGDTWTVDVENFNAYNNAAPTVTKIDKVVHSGARTFFNLAPGNNSIVLTDDTATTGYAVVKLEPSYL